MKLTIDMNHEATEWGVQAILAITDAWPRGSRQRTERNCWWDERIIEWATLTERQRGQVRALYTPGAPLSAEEFDKALGYITRRKGE